jgi:hypothetical protein
VDRVHSRADAVEGGTWGGFGACHARAAGEKLDEGERGYYKGSGGSCVPARGRLAGGGALLLRRGGGLGLVQRLRLRASALASGLKQARAWDTAPGASQLVSLLNLVGNAAQIWAQQIKYRFRPD